MESDLNSFDNDYAIGLTIEADLTKQESDVSHQLETFREQWKSEVAAKNTKLQKTVEGNCSSVQSASNIEAAKEHFLRGIESEKIGEMNNAVKSYRIALQLDPEIEQRLSAMQEFSQQGSDDEDKDETADDSISLLEKFSSLNLSVHNSTASVLSLNKSLHIMQLPSEIICHVFRCVASSHTDMKSVESLSQTCRRFYIHARDQTLWKAACERIWGPKISKKPYVDWRKMYIEKPQVRLDGVYISKVSYFRQGDPTVLNANYDPFQIVVYYRYLRFFDNNTMLLHTTSDEPSLVVSRLTLNNAKQLHFRTGKYKCHSESTKKHKTAILSCVLTDSSHEKYSRQYFKRATKSEKKYVLKESEYFMDLELTSSSTKRRFNKITWLKYSCQFKYGDGHLSPLSDIDVTDQYPSLYFSRVKSYVKRASEPL